MIFGDHPKRYVRTTDRLHRFIYDQAYKLLKRNRGTKPIRLLGISLTNFESDMSQQLSLFDASDESSSGKVDRMVDEVRDKFGYKAIHRASILNRKHGKVGE